MTHSRDRQSFLFFFLVLELIRVIANANAIVAFPCPVFAPVVYIFQRLFSVKENRYERDAKLLLDEKRVVIPGRMKRADNGRQPRNKMVKNLASRIFHREARLDFTGLIDRFDFQAP